MEWGLDGGQEENQSKAKGVAEICQLLAGFVSFLFSRQGFSIAFEPVLEMAL